MVISDQSVRRGEAHIPWWYGLAHRDESMRAELWLPVPLNFVVRVGDELSLAWDRLRGTPSRRQLDIDIAIRDSYEAGKAKGIVRGWQQALRHSGEAISLLGLLSDDDFAQRAHDYDYEPPDEIKHIVPFWKDRI